MFCCLLTNHHCPLCISQTVYFSCCWIHKWFIWEDHFFVGNHNTNGRCIQSLSCVSLLLSKPIYCFCVTLNCFIFCSHIFLFSPVYFCSQQIRTWYDSYYACIFLFLIQHHQNQYQICTIVSQIQCNVLVDPIYFNHSSASKQTYIVTV